MPLRGPNSGSRYNMDIQKQITILLVEDDKCAGELLTTLLERRFPQALISFVTDGNAGLNAVRRDLPDIVITDINMPEIDGVQLIKSIAAIKPDTRIVVVTAHSDNQMFDRITATGVPVEIVLKPIDFETLMTTIRRSADLILNN